MAIEGRGFPRDSIADVMPLYERTWKILSDANLVLYPVDVRGLVIPGFYGASMGGRPSRNFGMRSMAMNTDVISTLQSFAEATGGKAYYNRNDPLADIPVIWLQLGEKGLQEEMRAFGLEPTPQAQALVLELMRD